ncbi:MAG: PmbA/TldA family metallopeptidase [Nocardioidaceae bacterium]
MPAAAELDAEFAALPHDALASAARGRALDLGASHCDVRIEQIRSQHLVLVDSSPIDAAIDIDLGMAVRVVLDGTWGFAAGVGLTVDEAVRLSELAVAVARTAKPITLEPIELADEPSYPGRTWVSSYDVDPFTVPTADKAALLREWSERLLADPVVQHVSASVQQVRENKFYADSSGTSTMQQRVRLQPVVEVYGADPRRGVLDSMRSLAPPVGRGWEYLTGDIHDWDAELSALPAQLAAKLAAPSVQAGSYDLVVDP